MSNSKRGGAWSPELHRMLWGRKISSFHFFGLLGFIAGLAVCVALSWMLDLHPWVIFFMTAIGVASFFLLAYAARWITGKEMIVYYHQEIAILLFCTMGLLAVHLPVLRYLDIGLLGIGTFLAFGRLGCYSVGCCHGRPHRKGVLYGEDHVAAGFTWYYKNVPLLPVQLIEAAYVFLIVVAGIVLLFRHLAPGTVLIVYTVIYGAMRFVLEFFRGDPDRPYAYGLSEAQWTTLILVGLTYGAGMLGWLPYYRWHFVSLIILLALSLVVVLFWQPKEAFDLFSPPHMLQVAEGIKSLETCLSAGGGPLAVHTTPKGLSISSGNGGGGVCHYTVSLKGPRVLKKDTVRRLAGMIGFLGRHMGGYHIVEKQGGIFHILWQNTKPGGA